MSTASLLVSVLGPVVAICGVGALVGPRLDVDLGTLSRVAYWVLGPAFVFDLFITTEVNGGIVIRLALAGLAGMAAALVAAVAIGRGLGVTGRALAAATMTGAYGNVGNAGLAISAFALGDQALAAAGVLMLTVNISGITLGVGLASAGERGIGAAVKRALLSPMPIAGLLALAVNLSDVDLPLLISRSTSLLAGAMIPLMLFTLGLQLVSAGGLRLQRPIIASSTAKLLVAPAAAALAATALGLGGDELAVVVLQSAMPPAVFCVLVGIEYDLEPTLVTDTVVVTTVLSLVSLPVVLALVT